MISFNLIKIYSKYSLSQLYKKLIAFKTKLVIFINLVIIVFILLVNISWK